MTRVYILIYIIIFVNVSCKDLRNIYRYIIEKYSPSTLLSMIE